MGDFGEVDKVLHKKPGQSLEDCAKEIEITLDCVPNKPLENFFTSDLTLFHQLISVPVSQCSPKECKNDVDDILDWIRRKKDDLKDLSGEIKKVEQLLPQKSVQNHKIEPMLIYVPVSRLSPEERQNHVDDILDWIRSKKDDLKDPTGPSDDFCSCVATQSQGTQERRG